MLLSSQPNIPASNEKHMPLSSKTHLLASSDEMDMWPASNGMCMPVSQRSPMEESPQRSTEMCKVELTEVYEKTTVVANDTAIINDHKESRGSLSAGWCFSFLCQLFQQCQYNSHPASLPVIVTKDDAACTKCGYDAYHKIESEATIQFMHSCPRCSNREIHLIKKEHKKRQLSKLYQDQISTHADTYEEEVVEVDVKDAVEYDLCPEQTKELMKLLPKTVNLHLVKLPEHIPDDSKFDHLSVEIGGAFLDANIDLHNHPNTVERRPKESKNVVKMYILPLQKGETEYDCNFMAIMKAQYHPSDVRKFCAGEHQYIDRQEQGKRPGVASGVFLPENDCISLKGVQNDDTLYIASSATGVQMTAIYENEDKEVKRCTFGYNSVLSNQLDSGKRVKEAKSATKYANMH